MKRKSILYKDLEVSRAKEIYDESCKNILANKIILAWIMKSCMKEYKDCSIRDIADHYIEGIPEISQREVHRDEAPASDPGKIRGENTEDKAVNEGTVRYDIMFRAILPQGQEKIELIINIEAQKDFYPGYPLIKRGIYYGCRMISSQYGTIFINSHYEKIQKVYSIWICFNPPEKRKNSINIYSVKEKNVVGKLKEKEIATFRRQNLGFVFQDFNLLDTFSLKDNIFLPLVLSGKKYPEMEKRLKPIAEKLGIEKLLEKYPYEVSGGQKQRAAIARALITKPQLILADEPSGALDSKAADSLMNLFTTINQEGQTIVMVTHSVKAASSAKRVLFIKDGKVFHQLYRGNLTNEEMYERISDTLKILTTGGEEDE